MTVSCMSHLECSKCGKTYDPDQLNQLCSCGAPLLVKYDTKRLAAVKKDILLNRPLSM